MGVCLPGVSPRALGGQRCMGAHAPGPVWLDRRDSCKALQSVKPLVNLFTSSQGGSTIDDVDGNAGSEKPYFGPDSLTRRVVRERAMLLGGPRALVLQLAHPLVAAGVADHSPFAADPLARLRRTLDSTLAMVFGTRAQAHAAAAKITHVHGFVHGVLPEDAGRFPAGTPYDARDPDLLLWVHATLVDTTFTVYPRFVAPLDDREVDEAYEESKIAARLVGVPDEIIPASYADFRTYFEEMIASDDIAGAPFQRAVVQDVLYPSLRFVPKPVFWPAVALTTELLPPRVRELFSLELTPSRRRAAGVMRRVVRGMLPVMPRVLREMPQARRSPR
jgi:uncharacterized protein (DUF2236 family)